MTHKTWIQAKRAHPSDWMRLPERLDFHRAVRDAKRRYWRERIDNTKTDKELYQIISWHTLSPAIKPPPLIVEGRIIEDSLEKAQALRKELLERCSEEDDLEGDPFEAPVPPCQQLPWQDELTPAETAAHTIHVTSTSPGDDGITVRLLRACWEPIREPVRQLFQAGLQLGHHPRPFRTAEVVMLRKPKKKDLSSPRSWRPIALLSCLGKGLERIFARRIASIALAHKIISPQQAGAVPTRSATDLLACLTHDIEHALAVKSTATMLTLDVKGAFDATLRKRLMLRLRKQGWPPNVVRFTGSFMEDRFAKVRLDDTITSRQKIICGLPQGSPASPILFLLYIAEILLADPACRFGYADDLNILRTSKTLDRNAELLSRDLDQILSYGKEHKISFDPEKCELLHFTAARDPQLPAVMAQNHSFTVQPSTKPVKWLGVWFDKRLSFKHHVIGRRTIVVASRF